jgi:uncharacterized protein (TIGR00645 family)
MRRLELFLESFIFHSRWLMAPFYLGLVIALLLLLVHFIHQLVIFAPRVAAAEGSDVILGVLNLIELVFTGNLILIVLFSGYENFVSRLEVEAHDRPDWMTKVDFGDLKQKLMVSIVAISAVKVLEAFMNIERTDTGRLGWLVGIHVLFLGSMLVVAIADRLSEPLKSPEEKRKRGT